MFHVVVVNLLKQMPACIRTSSIMCCIAFSAILAALGKEHLIQDHEAIGSHMVYPEEDLGMV